MRLDKFTLKAQEALQAACTVDLGGFVQFSGDTLQCRQKDNHGVAAC